MTRLGRSGIHLREGGGHRPRGIVDVLVVIAASFVVALAGLPEGRGATIPAVPVPGRIVAVRDGRLVVLANGDGREVRVLARVGEGFDPGFEPGREALAPTPDGRAVFVTRFRAGAERVTRDVLRVPVDGKPPSVAVADAHAPALSPDGRFLSYLTDDDDELVVRNLRTGDERRTREARVVEGYEQRFVWTADGTQIAYTRAYDDEKERARYGYGLVEASGASLRSRAREVDSFVELVGRDDNQLVALYGWTGWAGERFPLEPGPWKLDRFLPAVGPTDPDAAPELHVELTGRVVDTRGNDLLLVIPHEWVLARGRLDGATVALARGVTTAAWLPGSVADPGEPELPVAAPPPTSDARLARVAAALPSVLGPLAPSGSGRCAGYDPADDDSEPPNATALLGCWEGDGPLPAGVDWRLWGEEEPPAGPLLTLLREAGIAGWVSGATESGPIIYAADEAVAVVIEVDELSPSTGHVTWRMLAWSAHVSPETGW